MAEYNHTVAARSMEKNSISCQEAVLVASCTTKLCCFSSILIPARIKTVGHMFVRHPQK